MWWDPLPANIRKWVFQNCPNRIWQDPLPANIRKWVFSRNKTWRNFTFAWNSCTAFLQHCHRVGSDNSQDILCNEICPFCHQLSICATKWQESYYLTIMVITWIVYNHIYDTYTMYCLVLPYQTYVFGYNVALSYCFNLLQCQSTICNHHLIISVITDAVLLQKTSSHEQDTLNQTRTDWTSPSQTLKRQTKRDGENHISRCCKTKI